MSIEYLLISLRKSIDIRYIGVKGGALAKPELSGIGENRRKRERDRRTGVLGAPRCGVCKSGPVLTNGMGMGTAGRPKT